MPQDQASPDAIIVPSDRTPTLVNSEAVTGLLIGDMIGGRRHAGTGMIAGGLIGGMLGKERIERENREGRVVRKPADMATSVLTAGGLAAVIGGVVGFLINPSAPALALGFAGIMASINGAIAAAMHGSRVAEYDQAAQYYQEHGGHYQGRAREESMRASGITREEAEALEKRLHALERKDFTARVENAPPAERSI